MGLNTLYGGGNLKYITFYLTVFKQHYKKLLVLVFLIVMFVDMEIQYLYFSSKVPPLPRFLPRFEKLPQVPLSSQLRFSKVPQRFSRTQPSNFSNDADQEAEPMVGIYEKLVENLTFFDRMANTNYSKMWEKVKALAPFDQKTYYDIFYI